MHTRVSDERGTSVRFRRSRADFHGTFRRMRASSSLSLARAHTRVSAIRRGGLLIRADARPYACVGYVCARPRMSGERGTSVRFRRSRADFYRAFRRMRASSSLSLAHASARFGYLSAAACRFAPTLVRAHTNVLATYALARACRANVERWYVSAARAPILTVRFAGRVLPSRYRSPARTRTRWLRMRSPACVGRTRNVGTSPSLARRFLPCVSADACFLLGAGVLRVSGAGAESSRARRGVPVRGSRAFWVRFVSVEPPPSCR